MIVPAAGRSVLAIAATDSSGGAGLARDLATLVELGVGSALAVTAVTVQTDRSVDHVLPISPDIVCAQIDAALSASCVAAIKLGMLAGAATIEAVANHLGPQRGRPAVLDPVIASSSGAVFLDRDAVATLIERLMPICTLITPNLPELGLLVDQPPAVSEEMAIEQANRLLALGAAVVLVKGGHGAGGKATDILVSANEAPLRFEAERLASSLRGTGCILSSAIAAYLARGAPIEAACRWAKAFVWSKLAAGSAGSAIQPPPRDRYPTPA